MCITNVTLNLPASTYSCYTAGGAHFCKTFITRINKLNTEYNAHAMLVRTAIFLLSSLIFDI